MIVPVNGEPSLHAAVTVATTVPGGVLSGIDGICGLKVNVRVAGADGALVCVQLPFCQIHPLPEAVRAYICPPLATSRLALTPPLLALPLRRISHSPGRPGAGPPKLQVPAAVVSVPVSFEIALPSGDTDCASAGVHPSAINSTPAKRPT